MKSYEGQDVVSLYIESLSGQSITAEEIENDVRWHTKITSAQLAANGGIQFRFETDVYGALPVCQYAIVRNGLVEFRRGHQWFLPGDTLFDTFGEAAAFSRRIKAASVYANGERTDD